MIDAVARRVSSPVLVGRAVEVGQLRAALQQAAAGSPATVVVAGEAGVGKTRLVGEVIGQAAALGAVTLAGGCLDVGDGVLAYAPVVEALRSLTALLDAADLDRVLGGARAELARLVPELGPPVAQADPVAPARLFELLLGVLQRLAERGPVLLVVEDLHWADRSTRDLLGFLVRNLRAGVCTVLTYRSDELHRRHPLRPFLAELERSGRAERLELGGLGRRELAELLAGILGERAAPALVTQIATRSAGNPFFAEELLAAHRDGTALPSALRDVVLARVEALSEPTQRVLQVAAIAGSRVDHQLLAAVSGQPSEVLIERLREAVAHHVLLVEAGGDGYAFRHGLVQEAIYDELLPVERAPLHAAYAAALAGRIQARTAASASAVELGRLAHHWYAAHDLGAALLACVQAGQAAEAAYALAEAQQHYQRALELWDQAPDAAARSPLDRRALLQRAAEAASLLGDTERAITLVELAIDAADADVEPLQVGALLERLARYHWIAADTPRAMAAVERAVATIPAVPPSRERARALARQGALLMLRSRDVEACARCEEAITVARQVGAAARAEEGNALTTLATALGGLGHLEVAIAHFQQARRIAEEVANADDLCRIPVNLGAVLRAAGRWEQAANASQEGYRLARRFGSVPTYGAAVLGDAVESLVCVGRWEEAGQVLDEVFELDLTPVLGIVPLESRALYRLQRGDLAGARADLVTVLEGCPLPLDPQYAAPLYARLTDINVWDDRLEAARDAAAEGLVVLAGCDEPALVADLCLSGLAAEAAVAERARARRSDDDLEQARAVAGALLERARTVAAAEQVVVTSLVRARLVTAEAEWSRVVGGGKPDRWSEAAVAWEELGCPYATAYARWRQTEALLAGGASRGDAAGVLVPAWTAASELGARLLAEEIAALARRARIELAPPAADGAAPPAQAGDEFGLTPREREVLALVVDGRTNRQIAEALYISDKTASVHVSNILAKLHAANRGEAAAIARRLGLG